MCNGFARTLLYSAVVQDRGWGHSCRATRQQVDVQLPSCGDSPCCSYTSWRDFDAWGLARMFLERHFLALPDLDPGLECSWVARVR